jgi:hypothetical protein
MAPPLFFTEVEIMPDGTTYLVIDVQNVDAQFALPIDISLTLSDNLSFALMRGLNNGLTITIPIATVESVGEGELRPVHFTTEQLTTLARYKRRRLHKVRSIFTLYLTKMGALPFFNMLISFAGLADQGYFITDDNREEKYLEIIATADQALITLLENYLEAYDRVKPIASMYDDLNTFEADLEVATDQAEVDAASHLFDTAY